MTAPTIFIIDDQASVRHAIGEMLEVFGFAVQTFDSAETFLDGTPATRPGCVVADVRMPGMDGIALVHEMRLRGIGIPIILISGHADVPMAVDALKKGARDFVVKPFNDNELVDRVLAAIEEDATRRATQERREAVTARLASLSERERQVMELMLAGRMNKVIADDLGIAMRTVEAHRARVLDKMGVRSAIELANLLAATRS